MSFTQQLGNVKGRDGWNRSRPTRSHAQRLTSTSPQQGLIASMTSSSDTVANELA